MCFQGPGANPETGRMVTGLGKMPVPRWFGVKGDGEPSAAITGWVQLCLGSQCCDYKAVSNCPPCVCPCRWHSCLEGTWQPFQHLPCQALLLWMVSLALLCQACSPRLSLLPVVARWLPCACHALPSQLPHTQLGLEVRKPGEEPHLSCLISSGRWPAWSHGPAR